MRGRKEGRRRGEIQTGRRKKKLKAVTDHMERTTYNIGIQRKECMT